MVVFDSDIAWGMEVVHLKEKVMKCCLNIYFNKQCLIKKVTPNYAKCKIPQTSPASNYTRRKIHNIRIKDEIRFLYKKKQKLNTDLYNIHLEATNAWGNTWHLITENVHESLNLEATKKYNTINKKTRIPSQIPVHAMYKPK
jgi:hypothetical protein